MAVKFYPTADEKIELVLACDPDVQEANDDKVLAAYLKDSDDSDLVKPDDATVFVISPLTQAQLSKARRDAGRPSVLGDAMRAKIQEDQARIFKEYKKMLDKAEADGDRELTKEEKESELLNSLFTIDDMDEKEYTAFQRASEFNENFNQGLIKAGLVEVKGWKTPDLSAIRPLQFQASVKAELFIHILHTTNMSAEAKG